MREARKYILSKPEYYLDITNNSVVFSKNISVKLSEVALITNVATNTVLYNPHCSGLGGTLANNVLTIETTFLSEMTREDELMVILQKNVPLEGKQLDSNKVIEENSHLLKEILMELRISNALFQEAFNIDATFSDRDLDVLK